MPIKTLIDGRKVNLPEGLTEAEQTNLVLKAFPDVAALSGMSYDVEREYDVETGVRDFSARFGAALANGNPDEIKAEFDGTFGKDNWGVSHFGELYATPEGMKAVGQETTDGRKVLLDPIGTDIYDLVDIIPEVVVGAGALAAELIPVPGTGVVGATAARGLLSAISGRGLVARSARAGFGDAAANVGLEGVQKLRGTQRESLSEVLQDAGTEGLVVGLGSIVLGAPFAAVGGVGNRIKAASKDLPPGAQGTRPLQLQEMIDAKNRVTKQVGEDDAMLLSLRTLVGEQGLVAGNILTKIEGVGAKQLGDAFAERTLKFMTKYRSIALESARLGDKELTTLYKLKTMLSKSEQEFGRKIVKELSNFNNSPIGKIDKAAGTMRGFKDLAEQRMLGQYRQSMKAFAGDEFYGQFKNIGGKTLTNGELAKFVQKIADDSGIGVDDVVNSFDSRVTSRIKVQDNGKVSPVFLTAAQKNRKTQATSQGEQYNLYSGEDISPQDLLNYDMAIRRRAYDKKANLAAARKNLEISKAAQNQIGKLPGIDKHFKSKLATVNKQYSKFANIYRGKNGLFEQIAKRPTDDSQAYLTQFINGKEGAEFATLLDKMDQAFGPNAVGGSVGLETREQLLGAMGVNFVRENKQDVLAAFNNMSPAEGAAAATKALKKINTLESTMIKKVGGPKAQKAMKQLFQQELMTDYKQLLKQISTGTPKSALKASQQLGLVMSFREAADFITKTSKYGSSLSKSNLDDAVVNLRALDALDKRNGAFYRDLMFSENWGRVINAMAEGTSAQKNAAFKGWADDWITARSAPNGVANMTELFGKEVYQGMDDLALNIRGALNIDANAGALSVAEQPVSLLRKIMRLDLSGAMKPLSFIFGSKQFAPGSPLWKALNKQLENGVSPSAVLKSQSGVANKALGVAQKASNGVMAGRNGLFAASVSSYLNEADQVYPMEGELPVVAPKKMEDVAPSVPQQQSMGAIPTDTGIAAIQQIAQMLGQAGSIEGVGTGGLEQGASLARSVA